MSALPPERRALRLSLAAGASYDLLLGVVILVLGGKMLEALGSPPVEPAFYLPLGVLPLFVLPVLYGVAAVSPSVDTFRPVVLWARGGGGGFLILLTAFYHPPVSALFYAVGAVDLLWAGVHGFLWRARD